MKSPKLFAIAILSLAFLLPAVFLRSVHAAEASTSDEPKLIVITDCGEIAYVLGYLDGQTVFVGIRDMHQFRGFFAKLRARLPKDENGSPVFIVAPIEAQTNKICAEEIKV